MQSFCNFAGRALCGGLLAIACFGQSEDLPRFGLGVKLSTLGAGIEAATAVTRRSNVRGGFNAFSYGTDFSKDGANYSGELRLRSAQVVYDQYLVGGLHVSPGVLIYNGNRGIATVSVPGGQSFSLGGTTYYSSAASPVTGNGTLNLGTVSPMVLIGVGNLLPRTSRHFAVNFEAGVYPANLCPLSSGVEFASLGEDFGQSVGESIKAASGRAVWEGSPEHLQSVLSEQ